MNDDLRTEYIRTIFGAHSIPKTVIGYYKLLNNSDEDNDDENRLFELISTICHRENIKDNQLKLLQHIFNLIIKIETNRNQVITQEHFDSTKKVCQTYVNWVFNGFPCFKKGEDDRHYFYFNQ